MLRPLRPPAEGKQGFKCPMSRRHPARCCTFGLRAPARPAAPPSRAPRRHRSLLAPSPAGFCKEEADSCSLSAEAPRSERCCVDAGLPALTCMRNDRQFRPICVTKPRPPAVIVGVFPGLFQFAMRPVGLPTDSSVLGCEHAAERGRREG